MFEQINPWLQRFPPLVNNLLIALAAIAGGILFKWFLSLFIRRQGTDGVSYSIIRSILSRLGRPLTFFLPLFILNLSMPLMQLDKQSFNVLTRIVTISLIIAFAGILIGLVKAVEDFVLHRYDISKKDNLRERKVRTQVQFFRNLINAVIVMLAICAILLSFESLRKIGTGLLTGVGVGGIIIGFAAQRSLGNLLAGLQIAFTQPIRIDDAVVVEGEFGRVEEITLTYVVVALWDQRRLILPINYFIEKPFQNWTRTGSAIMGTVSLFLDYTAPLEALRAEFKRLLDQSELWDKRVGVVQVVDAKESYVEVRFLVSATNSGNAFDLRCYLREQLIMFVQKNYPNALPKNRTVFEVDPFERRNGRESLQPASTGDGNGKEG